MSRIFCAFHHREWDAAGLADYSDFSERTQECNQGEDAFSGYGDWYYIPDEPLSEGHRVIYWGSWGNDNSPGASSYTHAEVYDMGDEDDVAQYDKDVKHWESQPEWLEEEDTEEDDDPIKDHYPEGECPDCGEPIPDDAVAGTECENCGHVFCREQDTDESE